jgi:hypothetical protein
MAKKQAKAAPHVEKRQAVRKPVVERPPKRSRRGFSSPGDNLMDTPLR